MKWSKVIYAVGLLALGLASYFLVTGLSSFAEDGQFALMLMATGIVFQMVESICFIGASSLAKTKSWKIVLLSLGVTLFLFSILTMTLAQKSVMMKAQQKAKTLDAKRNYLAKQIESLNVLIKGYHTKNAKDLTSKWITRRKAGEKSLNEVTRLESRKLKLINELHSLNHQRKPTSNDFFKEVAVTLNWSESMALKMEFWFIVGRSLLLEISAMLLLSFAPTTAKRKYTKRKTKKEPEIVLKQESIDLAKLKTPEGMH